MISNISQQLIFIHLFSLKFSKILSHFKDLIDVEEKDEIQKLQLAVARERLNELEEEAIARSRESIQAEEDVAEIEK